MVTDRAASSETTARWLGPGGGCWQAGARHLLRPSAAGPRPGRRGRLAPGGIEIGTVAVRKTPAAIADPLFAELPEVFHAQAVHRQTPCACPRRVPGPQRPSPTTPSASARPRGRVSPRSSTPPRCAAIRHLADALRSDGADPRPWADGHRYPAAAAIILVRFGRFVMERAVVRCLMQRNRASPGPCRCRRGA